MVRIPEPELMNEREQAEAYAGADFEEPHSQVMRLFDIAFPGIEVTGTILDWDAVRVISRIALQTGFVSRT